MGDCWICRWGWPKVCVDIYNRAVSDLEKLYEEDPDSKVWFSFGAEGVMKFGPAHIVWEDHNFDSWQWCLEESEKNRAKYNTISDKEMEILRRSLRELGELDPDVRDYCGPDEYESQPGNWYHDVEQFPPPPSVELVSAP